MGVMGYGDLRSVYEPTLVIRSLDEELPNPFGSISTCSNPHPYMEKQYPFKPAQNAFETVHYPFGKATCCCLRV